MDLKEVAREKAARNFLLVAILSSTYYPRLFNTLGYLY